MSDTAHEAALSTLLDEEEREDYERRRAALLAANALLSLVEAARRDRALTKKELAARAGLEPSSVRRLLVANSANPTAETAFRLLEASGVKLEAILPSGDRVAIL